MTRYLILTLLMCACLLKVTAGLSDIRSGDITVRQDTVNPLTFTVQVRLLGVLTTPFILDSITITWDSFNTSYKIPLADTTEAIFGRSYKTYYDTYTFSVGDTGIQKVEVITPSRVNGIGNIDLGNASNVQMHLACTFNLDYLKQDIGYVSPVFNSSPYIYDTVNKIITYPVLPSYSGDSFQLKLTTPLQDAGMAVPFYQMPDDIMPQTDNVLFVSDSNKSIVWSKPPSAGIFCIAFEGTEYHQGILVCSVVRDMLIYIYPVSTGIGEQSINLLRGSLFPNPASNSLTLTVSDFRQPLAVTITNTSGQLMQQAEMPSANHTLNVANLPKGIYFVSLANAQGRWVKRFVKQ